jgi:predicted MFS family arabinose efflux permease
VFYVNLPVGAAALAALAVKLPATPAGRSETALDLVGAVLVAGATSAVMLACIWGGDRYAWDSPPILSLGLAAVVLGGTLVLRERRAGDPIVPLGLLRTKVVAVASSALFLTTAALFAVTVFVPLFLQTTTGATPTEAGLLLVPAMAGITVSTTLAGRLIERTGRYKRFPLIGLGLMTAGLVLLGALSAHPSRLTIGISLGVFGLGFGMVTQVFIVAVQNSVERQQLGVATATTAFFRALGGAMGAAVLGAVFAAQVGGPREQLVHVSHATRIDVIDGVQHVFYIAAPVTAIALLITLLLPEVPLKGRDTAHTAPVPAGSRS